MKKWEKPTTRIHYPISLLCRFNEENQLYRQGLKSNHASRYTANANKFCRVESPLLWRGKVQQEKFWKININKMEAIPHMSVSVPMIVKGVYDCRIFEVHLKSSDQQQACMYDLYRKTHGDYNGKKL